MGEILSQDEIDQLLSAINAEPKDDGVSCSNLKRIKIYDFKRPDVFTKENLRTISNALEFFARAYTRVLADIAKKLKSNCKRFSVHVASVDQLTFEEFIRSIPTPSEISMAKSGDYSLLFEVDPIIAFGLMENQLENKNANKNANIISNNSDTDEEDLQEKALKQFKGRFLTDSEINIWNKEIAEKTFALMRAVCNRECEANLAKFKKIKFENNSQFSRFLNPTDMVCLVTLFVNMDDLEGTINFCLPRNLVNYLCNSYNGIAESHEASFDLNRFKKTYVPVEVLMGKTFKSIQDVTGFGVGTIIELDKLAGEPVDIRINGEIMAKGEVVVVDENFGVRICDML